MAESNLRQTYTMNHIPVMNIFLAAAKYHPTAVSSVETNGVALVLEDGNLQAVFMSVFSDVK